MCRHVFFSAQDLEGHVPYGFYGVRDQGALPSGPSRLRVEVEVHMRCGGMSVNQIDGSGSGLRLRHRGCDVRSGTIDKVEHNSGGAGQKIRIEMYLSIEKFCCSMLP